MTEKELLRAIGEIDENYIAEAAPASGEAAREETASGERKAVDLKEQRRKRAMRRRIIGGAAAAAAAVFVAVVIPGLQRNISRQSEMSVEMAAGAAPEAAEEIAAAPETAEEMAAEKAAAPAAETVPETMAAKAAAPEAPAETRAMAAANEFRAADEDQAMAAPAAAEDQAMAAPEMAAPAAAEKSAMRDEEAKDMDGVKAAPELTAGMGNPWSEYGSLEEAASAAGFTVTLPEETGAYAERAYFVMDASLLEVRFLDAEGNEGFRVRKAAGEEPDISGVYGDLEEKTAEADGKTVTCRMESGLVRTVTWTAEGYSYAVTADGLKMDEETAAALAAEVR